VPTRFERDTAVQPTGDAGVFGARVDRAWWVHAGPNGGYVAAIILRALTEAVGDPSRAPRSFTIHYTAPPDEGEITIATSIERAGRSLTSCSARVHQGDRLVALAVAAFSRPREGPEFCDLVPPAFEPPSDAMPVRPLPPDVPPIAHRWDVRFVIGRPPDFSLPRSERAETGGWIRLEEPQPFDAPAVAAITDAWVPPVFSRLNVPIVVPTVDLTVHFRSSLPLADVPPDAFLFVVFRTQVAAEGFLEEDGEVWTADGRLVAQSRQLAAVRTLSSPAPGS
jgi:acyl-CoA thioesterase